MGIPAAQADGFFSSPKTRKQLFPTKSGSNSGTSNSQSNMVYLRGLVVLRSFSTRPPRTSQLPRKVPVLNKKKRPSSLGANDFSFAFQTAQRQSWSAHKVQPVLTRCGSNEGSWKRVLKQLSKEGKPYPVIVLLPLMLTECHMNMKTEHLHWMLEACFVGKESKLAVDTLLKYTDNGHEHTSILPNRSNNHQQGSSSSSGSSSSRDRRHHPHPINHHMSNHHMNILDTKACQLALSACGAAADVTSANKILDFMRRSNRLVTVECWNAVLNAHAEARDAEGAMRTLELMLQQQQQQQQQQQRQQQHQLAQSQPSLSAFSASEAVSRTTSSGGTTSIE